MIEVQNATIERAGRVLCQDLSWQLPDPGTYLLLGLNGSGKSVLCQLLAGQMRPQQGNVLVDGRPVYGAVSARADCWFAEAQQDWKLDEPLGDYLEQELLRAGGRTGALSAAWALLEARLGGRRCRLSQLSHGQALLAHFALAACVPQRLVILDGHLSYFDPALGQTAAQLLHTAPPGTERFVLLTAARLFDYGFALRKVFALDAGLPLKLGELDWRPGADIARLDRRLVVYTDSALGQAWRLGGGRSFSVFGANDAGGWQIRLLGGMEQFLEEMREQGITLTRLEWEAPSRD